MIGQTISHYRVIEKIGADMGDIGKVTTGEARSVVVLRRVG